MLNVAARSERTEEAFELASDMRRKGLQLDTVSYTALLNACAKAADPTRALEVIDEMAERNVPCQIQAYTCVMDACVREGSEEALVMVCPLFPPRYLGQAALLFGEGAARPVRAGQQRQLRIAWHRYKK